MANPKDLSLGGPSPLRTELLNLLCCPEDRGALSGWDGVSEKGALVCESCGRAYPVSDGVACLLPDALREPAPATPEDTGETAEKRREMEARDDQADAYDRMLGLKVFTSAEVPLSLRYLWPEPGHLMLEGGCGTGRMTPAFADRVRGLVAIDFSATSLQAARRKLSAAQREKTLFLQADLTQLPLRPGAFDRVGSFGVYEHIPTPESRDRALSEMARVVKPREEGGRWAMSAYRWGVPQSLVSEREGHHDGGIYFRRFTMAEMRELVSRYFQVGGATEALLYYHLLWGRKRES